MPAAHRCLTLHWRSEFGIGRRPLVSSTKFFVHWLYCWVDGAGEPYSATVHAFVYWAILLGLGLVLGVVKKSKLFFGNSSKI